MEKNQGDTEASLNNAHSLAKSGKVQTLKYITGTGEMVQRFRAVDALAEDPGFVPSTHFCAHNHL